MKSRILAIICALAIVASFTSFMTISASAEEDYPIITLTYDAESAKEYGYALLTARYSNVKNLSPIGMSGIPPKKNGSGIKGYQLNIPIDTSIWGTEISVSTSSLDGTESSTGGANFNTGNNNIVAVAAFSSESAYLYTDSGFLFEAWLPLPAEGTKYTFDASVATITTGTFVNGVNTNTTYDLSTNNIVVVPASIGEDEVKTYTVKFVDWDGTELKTETVEEGKAATAPADPVREGYTFTGWDVDFSNITADLIVTAQYEQEEPPVTEEATKVEFGEEGKAIFFDSEAKTYTLGVDAYINITSAADGVTKKFGHQYFLNDGIESEEGATITATFGVVADDKYADGNFSFEIINN